MRSTIIPAQITTVEDRIAGNFNLTQILLLIMAVFLSTGIFTILPPINQLVAYKLIVIGMICLICLTLALRIKDKVMLNWLIVVWKYKARPRYYDFDKNDNYLRDLVFEEVDLVDEATAQEQTRGATANVKSGINLSEVIKMESLLNNPDQAIHFKITKGGNLHVALK